MAVWQDKFIKPNQYSRPQKKLEAVRKVVIHWTANFGATANGHYNYFNNLSGRYASAHFFVDKNEALCIIPLNEIAYHANDGTYKGIAELKPNANFLSVGIELCVEKDGSFHPTTIAKAVDVAVELCKRYKLDPMTDIVRHYDVTHKNCPAPWVKDSAPFTAFKKSVNAKLNPPKPQPAPAPTKPVTGDVHTVVDGDTLWGISRKYNVSVDTIKSLNGLKNDTLSVGQKLKLKASAPKPAPKPTPAPAPKAIGNVVIETAKLNIRKSADLDAQIVGTAIKGAKFPVYEQKNGMLRIGEGKWISANEKYSKYTPVSVAKYHTVVRGDTVSELAEKYGSTVAQIKAWNKLDSKYTLQLGQKLRVK